MRKAQVKLQGRYECKVSGELVAVTILAVSQYGGWDARNEKTGRAIRVKSAQRLRRALA